jgi:hypothetical protein
VQTTYDVLRYLVHETRGSAGEARRNEALAVIDREDPNEAEAKRKAHTELSDAERQQLDALQAKQARGAEAKKADKEAKQAKKAKKAAKPAKPAKPAEGQADTGQADA